jgi:organic hydroperoxide reductase OsmC/OhrA
MKSHTYSTTVEWTGNDGAGTRSYTAYRRDHVIDAPGKPSIPASSDPAFRGDRTRYNPEELLVASLSSCHMLWYLHLCSANGISVIRYRDAAVGVVREADDGSGAFESVVLKPVVTIAASNDLQKAIDLHTDAHHMCFIAQSVRFPVSTDAEINVSSSQM